MQSVHKGRRRLERYGSQGVFRRSYIQASLQVAERYGLAHFHETLLLDGLIVASGSNPVNTSNAASIGLGASIHHL